MFEKNLKFYRLKNDMTKTELASRIGVSPMTISNYESGKRKPDMENIKRLAAALNVRVADFLADYNEHLVFSHGEFRKNLALTIRQQEYVREAVEAYFGRFYAVVEALGGKVLPDAPQCHVLELSDDVEIDAENMRRHLGLAEDGPIEDLIGILENKGILVCKLDIDNDRFSGMNGTVNGRPYIVINGSMNTERNRATIVHEMAHLMFIWPEEMPEKTVEKRATAISGAFLLTRKDAVRELGIKRTKITKDMELVCKEYGISMSLLTVRARHINIISEYAERLFFIRAGQMGWRKNEPTRIHEEETTLFQQLVYRAVSEDDISIQKGAELLQVSYQDIVDQCCYAGV